MSGAPPLSVHTRAHYTPAAAAAVAVEYQSEQRISSGALIKGNKKGGRCVTERLLLSLGLGRRTQWTSPLLDPRRRRPHHLLQQRRRPCQHTRAHRRTDDRARGSSTECAPLPPLRCYHTHTHTHVPPQDAGGCCWDFFSGATADQQSKSPTTKSRQMQAQCPPGGPPRQSVLSPLAAH